MRYLALILLLTGCAHWPYDPAKPPPATNQFKALPPLPHAAAPDQQISALAIVPHTNAPTTNRFISIPYPAGLTTNAFIEIDRGPTLSGPWRLLSYFVGLPGTNNYDVAWTNTGEFFNVIIIHP